VTIELSALEGRLGVVSAITVGELASGLDVGTPLQQQARAERFRSVPARGAAIGQAVTHRRNHAITEHTPMNGAPRVAPDPAPAR